MAQEVDDWPEYHYEQWNWTTYENKVTEQLSLFSPAIAAQALQLYPSNDFYTPEFQYTTMISDARVMCPIQVCTMLP